MSELDTTHFSPQSYLPVDGITHGIRGNERYTHNPHAYADALDSISGLAYSEYIAAELDFSRERFANASTKSSNISDEAAGVKDYATYRQEKTKAIENGHVPYTISFDQTAHTIVEKPLTSESLARFSGPQPRERERFRFAPLVPATSYAGDNIPVEPRKQPGTLETLAFSLRAYDQWLPFIGSWAAEKARKIFSISRPAGAVALKLS